MAAAEDDCYYSVDLFVADQRARSAVKLSPSSLAPRAAGWRAGMLPAITRRRCSASTKETMKRACLLLTAAATGSLAFGLAARCPVLAAAPPSAASAASPGNVAPAPKSAPVAKDAGPAEPSRDTGTSGDDREANKEAIPTDDASASRNAARTRMRECGHQWSTMKKSGAATGMTWKDFSQGCLARK